MANSKGNRSANGSGTIRKKTATYKGKEYTYWEARVTTGVNPGTGRQVQRSFTGKTQKEVRQKMQAAAVELNENEYMEPSRLTLGRWLDLWLRDFTGDKKYQTVKHYRAQCETHIKPALGAVLLKDLDTAQIQRFYKSLEKTGKTQVKHDRNGRPVRKNGVVVTEKVPLAPKSIHNVHHVLSSALNKAVELKYIKMNPSAMTTLPKVPDAEIEPLTDDQVKDFLAAVDDDSFAPILKVILFTGMREAEAVGLTWDAVNFKDNTLKISKQLLHRRLRDGGETLASLKNDKYRIVRPAKYVMDIIRRQWDEQPHLKEVAGDAWVGWQDDTERKRWFVFTNSVGRNLKAKTVYMHLKKLAAKIGTPDSTVHDLRHTYAVLSLQNGDDIKTVQGNLGHATAAFTLDKYGHVSERMRSESADRMDTYIRKNRSNKGKNKGKNRSINTRKP